MNPAKQRIGLEQLWQKAIDAPVLSWFGAVRVFLLWPLSLLYRLGFAISKLFAPKPLQTETPLIVVGGLTVGGAGKTPFVALLVRELLATGRTVAVALAGYGRADTSDIVATGSEVLHKSVGETGDEPRELAAQFPDMWFAISESKRAAVRALDSLSESVDVIIVDDGFQTRGVSPDVAIALISARASAPDFRMLPAGRLREATKALERADMVVISKLDSATSEPTELIRSKVETAFSGPVYHSAFTCELHCMSGRRPDAEYLNSPTLLVSALADNEGFRRSAKRVCAGVTGAKIVGAIEFPDHFRYASVDVAAITAYAKEVGAESLLTTAKDWAKLSEFTWDIPVWTLNVRAELREKSQFMKALVEKLAQHPGADG